MSGYVKQAWVRDQSVPPGKPARGRIHCPCGRTPESDYGQAEDIHCPCGITYDGYGWIVSIEGKETGRRGFTRI